MKRGTPLIDQYRDSSLFFDQYFLKVQQAFGKHCYQIDYSNFDK
jgi:hypothetical protein